MRFLLQPCLVSIVACFGLLRTGSRVDSIAPTTRYFPVLARIAVRRSSQMDCSLLDYSALVQIRSPFCQLHEMLPTHRGGRNYPGSKHGVLKEWRWLIC